MSDRVRHIVGCFVLLCTLVSVHGSLVARGFFELRQEHIAEHHCENRFVPGSTCDGFCFLKKRMAEAEHHEHERHAPQVMAPVLLYVAASVAPSAPPLAPAEAVRAPEVHWQSDPHDLGVDHPPRMI